MTPIAPIAALLDSQRDSTSPHGRARGSGGSGGKAREESGGSGSGRGSGVAHGAPGAGAGGEEAPSAATGVGAGTAAAALLGVSSPPGLLSAGLLRKRPLSQDAEGNYKRTRFAIESQEAAAAATTGPEEAAPGSQPGSPPGSPSAAAATAGAATARCAAADGREGGGQPAGASGGAAGLLADHARGVPVPGEQGNPAGATGAMAEGEQGGRAEALAAAHALPAWAPWGSDGETGICCTQPGSTGGLLAWAPPSTEPEAAAAAAAPNGRQQGRSGLAVTATGPQPPTAASTPQSAWAALALAEWWAAAGNPRLPSWPLAPAGHGSPAWAAAPLSPAGGAAVPAAAGQDPTAAATPAVAWRMGSGSLERGPAPTSLAKYAGAAPGATPRFVHSPGSASPEAAQGLPGQALWRGNSGLRWLGVL